MSLTDKQIEEINSARGILGQPAMTDEEISAANLIVDNSPDKVEDEAVEKTPSGAATSPVDPDVVKNQDQVRDPALAAPVQEVAENPTPPFVNPDPDMAMNPPVPEGGVVAPYDQDAPISDQQRVTDDYETNYTKDITAEDFQTAAQLLRSNGEIGPLRVAGMLDHIAEDWESSPDPESGNVDKPEGEGFVTH